MRNLTQDTITQAVIARLANTPDARLREMMTSLVQHLHAFARDVKLTERELAQGIRFLADAGRKTDRERQELVLLSDTLGLSLLTMAMNSDQSPAVTALTQCPAGRVRDDGPVAELLRATGQAGGPEHLRLTVEAPGYERLVSDVFGSGDAGDAGDARHRPVADSTGKTSP